MFSVVRPRWPRHVGPRAAMVGGRSGGISASIGAIYPVREVHMRDSITANEGVRLFVMQK